MIDRRQFVRTAAAGVAGAMVLTCSDGVAQSSSRRRAVGRGQPAFRSSAGELRAEVRAARTEVSLGGRTASLYTFNGSVPGPRFEARAGVRHAAAGQRPRRGDEPALPRPAHSADRRGRQHLSARARRRVVHISVLDSGDASRWTFVGPPAPPWHRCQTGVARPRDAVRHPG